MSETLTDAALRRFPFPFESDSYMYSVNVEEAERARSNGVGHWGQHIYDVDGHYRAEVAERARILRGSGALPGARAHAPGGVGRRGARDRSAGPRPPAAVRASRRDGDRCRWTNRLMDIDHAFTLGDEDTLPHEPFEWITRQLQEDIELLDQRDDDLFFDAGILTFGADWSLGLRSRHALPRGPRTGATRARARGAAPGSYVPHAPAPGRAYRRTNWTMTVDRRLDTGTELATGVGARAGEPALRGNRRAAAPTRGGAALRAATGVQRGHVPIHTYLASLEEISEVPAWSRRLEHVLADLPDDLVDYKGLARYRDMAVAWLHERNARAAPTERC